jgi:hypothetical protein
MAFTCNCCCIATFPNNANSVITSVASEDTKICLSFSSLLHGMIPSYEQEFFGLASVPWSLCSCVFQVELLLLAFIHRSLARSKTNLVTCRAKGLGLVSGQVFAEAGSNTVIHEGIKADEILG